MASSIRVRAIATGNNVVVQSLIQHPMDSGFIKDGKGQLIPPHYIEIVTFEHNDKNVFMALAQQTAARAQASIRQSMEQQTAWRAAVIR